MNLRNFLLDRITDDERIGANLPSVDNLIDARNAEAITMQGAQAILVVKHRLRGELEAKRRVVASTADEQTLRLLALPYADHPDFRAEWR